jgi:hypothetical protein
MAIGKIPQRNRLNSQQCTKAKMIPKALVKMALINSATFSPIAFSIILIFFATVDANLPTSIESYHATYCCKRV